MATKAQRPTVAQPSIAAREARTRKVMRIVAIAVGIPVAAVAIEASYFHIVPLAILNGQSQSTAHLLPIPIDGLMLVAAIAMIGQRDALIPKISFAIGAAITLASNALSVHPIANPWIALVLAGTPAVALLLSAEMLLRLCLPTRTASKPAAAKAQAPAKVTAPKAQTPAKAPESAAKAPARPARTRAPRQSPIVPVATPPKLIQPERRSTRHNGATAPIELVGITA